jgi:VWFA-related protein
MARLCRLAAVSLLAALALAAQPQAQNTPPDGKPAQPQTQATDQPPQTPDQPPIFRAGINFVRVDVIVSDKNGNPVGDLKPEDFEVTEQGKAQKVETFKLVSLDGGLIPGPDGPPRQIRTDDDEETEAARDDVRLFAIFLDDYHVQRGASMSAREQVARFVETQLGPSDMIGLMYPLEATASVRMTRNHDAIVKGIRQFLGRKYDYTPRNEFEERYAYYPTEVVEKVRNQVSMSAIKALITHMGGLKEGRKALILVSEGYSNMLPPQMRNQIATIPGSGNVAAGDPNAGVGSPLEDRAAFLAGADMESDLRELYDTANKNNVAIYAVDPRGLATNEFGIDQNIGIQQDRQYLSSTMDTLRTLALNTDGRAIVNRNDLTAAMKQIVRDTSAYYLLGYNSTFTATDGKFHEIKVRVKRPGVQVRARKGYWAFTREDAAKALAPPRPDPPKAVENAIAAISQPSRSRVVRTWIGTERGSNGKTKVTFVWEPAQRGPGDQPRNSAVPARVTLMAVGPDGAPYFRGRVPDGASPTASAAALAPGATSSTVPSKVSFEAQPGKMQLRVSVESAASEVLDSEVREIVVPDLTTPQAAIGTPAVFRARTVRELQQLKADAQSSPTAAREFIRSDRVFMRVPTYGGGATGPTLTAKLLNRAGQPMSELPVGTAGANGTRDIDLTLSALPPGEYLVEISATGDGAAAKELVGFRVVG